MPKYKDAPQVYEVMARFKDRCLLHDGSLLWDGFGIWTVENLKQIKKRCIDKPDNTDRSFWEKIAAQFHGLPRECYMILADAFVIYSLPSTFIRPETKWHFVETVCELGQLEMPGPESVSEALAQGFTRTSTRYHVKYMQLWLTMLFALRLKEKGTGALQDPWESAALLDDCLAASLDKPYDMRHAILHMLFPDEFERMISTDHKRRVVEAFLGSDRPSVTTNQEDLSPSHKGKHGLIALDRDVAAARKKMIEEFGSPEADFYSPQVARRWGRIRDSKPEAEGELLAYGRLQELVNPLKEAGQIILYGPPGTGKTYYAMKLAEALIASENLNVELKTLTREELEALKSGEPNRDVGAWWFVANPRQWSWQNSQTGEGIEFLYGQRQKYFEMAQPDYMVIGYEATPTLAVRALGRISESVHKGKDSDRPAVTVEMTHLLSKPIPYSDIAGHPILRDSEPVRQSNRGTLFRLGKAETRTLLEMIRKKNPGIDVGQREEGKDDAKVVPDVPYLRLCTFHPAYGYEDFVEGYRPDLSGDGQPYYSIQDGIFKRICNDARQQPDKTFVLIIDEINRGNIPRIFGELITLIERDKRWKPGSAKQFSAVLQTSQESFAVPENVYIIGTMNTADKSIALFDAALRRRFAFKELLPDPSVLAGVMVGDIALDKLMIGLNRRITEHLNRNLQIGHAYFMDGSSPVTTTRRLAALLRDKVFPLLQDYCYDDYSTLAQILGDEIVDVTAQAFRPEVIAAGGDDLLLKCMANLLGGH